MISEEVFSGLGNWNLFRCHFHKIKQPNNRLRGSLILKSIFQNFPEHPKYWGYLETSWTIRKRSRLSGNFPDSPKTFQTTPKLSRLSGYSSDYTKIFQAIQKLSIWSGNFTEQFQGLRARTFWMAMPRCHDGFCVSARTMQYVTPGGREGQYFRKY